MGTTIKLEVICVFSQKQKGRQLAYILVIYSLVSDMISGMFEFLTAYRQCII